MANDNHRGQFRVILSHEELAFLLGLMGATPTIGVDDDPLSEKAADQVSAALSAAGHGLQARELVQIDAGGQPVVQTELLAATGVYAFPERLVTLYHWGAGEALPAAFFGYVRGATVLSHARPAPFLHEFEVLDSAKALIDRMVANCGVRGTGNAVPDPWLISAEALAQVRESARLGQRDAALASRCRPKQPELPRRNSSMHLPAHPMSQSSLPSARPTPVL
ncbi:MAG: hypothetical protein IPK16_28510 [Anaerolineales bacterium]|nr:hypothetical protein [Anaerolineales bacterium]